MPFERVLTTVVLCRLQDFPPVVLVCGLAVLVVPGHQIEALHEGKLFSLSQLQQGLYLLGASIILGAVILVFAFFYREMLQRVVVALTQKLSNNAADWLDFRLSNISTATEALKNPLVMLYSQGIAFLCWALFAAAAVPLLLGFGASFYGACISALVLTGLTTLAQMLPAAPGALGTFHVLGLAALELSMPELIHAEALALVVLLHLLGTLGPALPGFFFLPSVFSQKGTQSDTMMNEDSDAI
jgi:uncharacterized membrane protein YbhN (UPF0104 family)